MATITNNEKGPITLPTGQVIPRLGTLETDNDTIRQADNWPSLSGRALAKQITIVFDPDPDPGEPDLIVTQTVIPHEPTAVLQFTATAPNPDEELPHPTNKGKHK